MTPPADSDKPSVPNRPLERLTGFVLGLVLLAIGWILVAAASEGTRSAAHEDVEVTVVLVLLVAALGLVSVVALLHTRPKATDRN